MDKSLYNDNKILIYDGSKGTMLQLAGLKNECAEEWNLEKPDEIFRLMEAYVEAGSDIIQTNTFNANTEALAKHNVKHNLKPYIRKGIEIAKRAAGKHVKVAFSAGPTGSMLEPYGEMTFEKAYHTFREIVKIADEVGADLINFETFTDLYEMKAALLAAKDVSDLPVMCCLAFDENARTLMGDTPEECAELLTRLGASAVGANCSFGPEKMTGIIEKMRGATPLPIVAKPNAGLPQNVNGEIVYAQTAQEFGEACKILAQAGATIIGGCCGTTPEFIKVLALELKDIQPYKLPKNFAYEELEMDGLEVAGIIPKKWDEDTLTDMAFECLEDKPDGVCIYDDGYGRLDLAAAIFTRTVKAPVFLATPNAELLEKALRTCPGNPGLWIPDGEEELEIVSSDVLQKFCKKYGCKVITT